MTLNYGFRAENVFDYNKMNIVHQFWFCRFGTRVGNCNFPNFIIFYCTYVCMYVTMYGNRISCDFVTGVKCIHVNNILHMVVLVMHPYSYVKYNVYDTYVCVMLKWDR